LFGLAARKGLSSIHKGGPGPGWGMSMGMMGAPIAVAIARTSQLSRKSFTVLAPLFHGEWDYIALLWI